MDRGTPVTQDQARRAWDAATATVGMYGDPEASWSIVASASLACPLDPGAVRDRMAVLAGRFAHLGGPPEVVAVPDLGAARETFATTHYDRRAPLVRVGVRESTVLVGAHHGAVDGLGLLALLGAATGETVRSNARGLAGRPAARSFALSAVQRVGEAVFRPPVRFRVEPATQSGEVLLGAELPRLAVDTAALTAAAAQVLRWWNGAAAGPRRIVAAIGASRRSGMALDPANRAAYLRLRLPPEADRASIRALLSGHAPEPDFPPSRNPVLRLGTRVLANRLGSSFLASNLGVVEPGTLRAVSFYPQPAGPAGIAFGAASTAYSTNVTIRARRRDFSDEAAKRLLDRLVTVLSGPS
jgi:hypothetical protein